MIILAWTPFFSSDLAESMYEVGLSDCEFRCIATNDRRSLSKARAVLFHIRDMKSTDLPLSRSQENLFTFYLYESPPHTGDILHYIPSDYFNLTMTYRSLSKARAVLFHIRDMKSTDLPLSRSQENLFTFYLYESPPHTGDILHYIPSDYFNLTMTYRSDSDVQAVYGLMRPINNFTSSEEMWRWEEIERIAENKTKSALLFVSNCVTESKRELYARELARYIEVSEFGQCSKRECNAQCAEREIAQHHFYLAFENSVCRDYVTEKAFMRMEKIIVPVVLKRSIASSLLPNGSFIAADDFDSPASLAAYMQHLETNKTEYLKYFEWTKVYKRKTKLNYACSLCTFLHMDSKNPRVIHDIKSWWFGNGGCIKDYAKHLLTH
uniref:Fucosyltransferase n=1 Tax=Ascaris lumbricoides TaxID=6252 RepID=A0A0M3IR54_ASCLU